MRCLPALRWLWIAAASWLWPATAGAELVIFTHGSFLKVESFEVTGDKVRLGLPDGGAISVPLLRIARIVEDEVSAETPEPPPAFDWRFDPAQPRPQTPYAELIYGAAERHGLNPALIAAMAGAESAFDVEAVSIKGARGLMQLMPATARRFGLAEGEAFDAAKNLDAAGRYLRWLVERFDGDLPSVLAAYNAGEGTVDRYGGVPPYRETHQYLRRIYATLGLPESDLPIAGSG
ncbi:MAG: lytic transglycosylase domain-containing protein [Thermoanaerobaculia bacterium]